MISEQELAELSFPDAPRMITDGVPGPKAEYFPGVEAVQIFPLDGQTQHGKI